MSTPSEARTFIRPAALLAGSAVALAVLYLLVPEGYQHPGKAALVLRIVFGLWLLGAMLFLGRLSRFLRKNIPDSSSLILAMLRDGPHRTLWEIYRRHAFQRSRLWLLYVFWGILIVALILGLSTTHRFDDIEADMLLKYGTSSAADSVSTIRILILESGDNNPTRYLRDLKQIVGDLKKCGARGVVARIPTMFEAAAIHKALVDSIQQSGIAILFSGYGQPGILVYPFFFGHEKEIFSRDAFFVEPVLDDGMTSKNGIIRWSPFDTTKTPPAVDALTAAAARAKSSPDSLHATVTRTELRYGPIRLPLNARGRATVFRHQHQLRDRLMVSAVHRLDADSLHFFRYPEWHSSSSFPMEEAASVEGCVVFVENLIPPYMTKWEMHECASIVESLLRDEAISEYEWMHPCISIMVVLLSGLVCLRFRPGIASVVILTFGVLFLASSVALLSSHHALLHAAYPVAAAFLSGVIFPLVRMSHEHP